MQKNSEKAYSLPTILSVIFRFYFNTCITDSTVKPYSLIMVSPRALIPNLSIDKIFPWAPTYRPQPKLVSISIDTRAVTSFGRKEFLYASVCCWNSSKLGMKTTETSLPSATFILTRFKIFFSCHHFIV
ncbi:hypothetical protein IGI46_004263 [Enterococcus sp. AZ163]